MDKPTRNKSALNVMDGIEQPGQVNEDMVKKMKTRKPVSRGTGYYVKGIVEGNRTILSQAITLIESSLPAHQKIAQEIIAECLKVRFSVLSSRFSVKKTHQIDLTPENPEPNNEYLEYRVQNPEPRTQNRIPSTEYRVPSTKYRESIRIGITGVPGVGKSTFIEALGKYLTSNGHKLAVLAIDPSSSKSKGSILGDKTRMEELAVDPHAFIRPSPSAGSLGGVARKTRETIILCEAAGFDVIFIETVGVGQSETTVHSMVDFFLLLMLAGAGDELQGIKRGIIEMADAIMINKADGDNLKKAKTARVEYANALHLFPPSESGWIPPVGLCSAISKMGIEEVWKTILDYKSLTSLNGFFQKRRMEQNRQVLYESIEEALKNHFFSNKEIASHISALENEIILGRANPYVVAQELLINYFSKGNVI